MTKRRCLGCPQLIDAGTRDGRCNDCRRDRDRARGTRQQRGYDAEHDAERAAWAPHVAAGTVTCRRAPYGRCLEHDPIIRPGQPWHLGHPDADCPAPRAPEHQLCNVSTAPRRVISPDAYGGGGDPSNTCS